MLLCGALAFSRGFAQGGDAAKVAILIWGEARANDFGDEDSASYGFDLPEALFAGGNGSTTVPGANFSASGVTVSLVPGKAYVVNTNGSNLAESNIRASAPPGYVIEFNGIERTVYGDSTMRLRIVSKYHTFFGRAGTSSSLSTGQTHWQVALGYLANGDPARSLAIVDVGTDANWSSAFTPRGLSIQSSEVSLIPVSTTTGPFVAGEIRQVVAPEVVVDIVPAAGRTSYEMRFYHRASVSPAAPYTPTGSPYVKYTVARDGSDTKLKITRTDLKENAAAGDPPLRTFVTTVERTGTAIDNFVWKMEDWHLSGQPAPVIETAVWSTNATGRLETIMRKDGAGATASVVTKQYQMFFWGEERVGMTRGLINPVTTTVAYPVAAGFLRTENFTGGGWEARLYSEVYGGRLMRLHRPFNGSPASPPAINATTGLWDTTVGEVTHLTYGPGEFDRVATTVTTVNNVQTAKTTTVYLDPPVPLPPLLPQAANGARYVVATRSDWSSNDTAAPKLLTYTKFYREDAESFLLRNQIHSVQNPDGTKQSFAYQSGDFDETTFAFSATTSGGSAVRVAVVKGTIHAAGSESPALNRFSLPGDAPSSAYTLDAIYLVSGKSTAEVMIRDASARLRRQETYLRSDGAWTLLTSVNYTYDYAHRLIRKEVNQGVGYASYVASYQTVLNQVSADTGVLQWEQDETGIKTAYTYDSAGRVETVTKKGVGTIGDLKKTLTYDADGHVLTEVVGPGGGETLTTRRTFDDAGRIKSEKYPGLGSTDYAYDPISRTQTVTSPAATTRIETFEIDGRLSSVTGTGVVHEYYHYDVDPLTGERIARVNLGTTAGLRQAESRKDQVGRPTTHTRPGFTGQPEVVQRFIYEGVIGSAATGQLTRTTRTGYAPTLYEYTTLGTLKRRGQRISSLTGTLEPASDDRIVDTDTFFESYLGAWWLTSTTGTYFTAGSGASHVVAKSRTRLTGFTGNRRAEVRFRDAENQTEDLGAQSEEREVIRTVDVDSLNATVTVNTKRPGHAFDQVAVSVNGLATSATGHDANPFQTTYDALHRVSTRVDPRAGATTLHYRPTTPLVSWLEDATKTTTAPGNAVTYGYDSSGRVTAVTDPTGKVARTSYHPLGQILQQWGDAAYPVSYDYTALGERKTLTTYQSGDHWGSAIWPGGTSSSVTTWTYDPPSGLLSAKSDAAGASVDYTYNLRGQVDQRKSPRRFPSDSLAEADRITATYGYDANTGELLTTTYSEGTPALTHTYTRAGQIESVTQAADQGGAGSVDFIYDPTAPWRRSTEDWGGFYGGRVVTELYESANIVGAANGFYTHAPATVRGRSRGFQIGVIGSAVNLARDRNETLTYSSHGRIVGVSSRPGTSPQRDFVYGYAPNSSLVSGYTSGAFAQAIAFEPKRDLPRQIATTSTAPALATITQHDYVHNARGERESAKQSGTAFADFGASTYYRYAYNARGEVRSAANYLGEDQNTATAPQLSGRNFAYDYDPAGNRRSANRTGVVKPSTPPEEDPADTYVPNDRNQYESKENNAYTVGGTAHDQATVTVTGASLPVTVGRQGRFWGAQIFLPDPGTLPTKAALNVTAALGATAQTQNRTAYVAAGAQSFAYFADGNLKSDGVWTYTWDAENRLIRMDAESGAVGAGFPNRWVEFKYDYLGRRIQKRSVNVTAGTDTYRRYLYDGWNLVAEFDATATNCGALRRSFTWGLDVTGSLSDSGGVGALVQITDHAGGGAVYLPARDANGNITALIDAGATAAGANPVAASYEYSPFGELLRVEGKRPVEIHLTGLGDGP